MDGVYNGCHEHRFPEISADKHREHVVQIRAPNSCVSTVYERLRCLPLKSSSCCHKDLLNVIHIVLHLNNDYEITKGNVNRRKIK